MNSRHSRVEIFAYLSLQRIFPNIKNNHDHLEIIVRQELTLDGFFILTQRADRSVLVRSPSHISDIGPRRDSSDNLDK